MPDFNTIADFRKDDGPAIRKVCASFIELCRQMKLFTDAVVAIDGSKFKAVNNRDRNFTQQKIKSRLEHLEKSVRHPRSHTVSAITRHQSRRQTRVPVETRSRRSAFSDRCSHCLNLTHVIVF